MPRFSALLAVATAALTPPAAAQFASPTLPRGHFAVDIRTWSSAWDHHFLDGQRHPSGSFLTQPSLGADYLPFLRSTEDALAVLATATTPVLNLGSLSTVQMTTEREFGLGVGLGITSRLSVSILVPIRRVRVRTHMEFDESEANAGLNPAHPGLGTTGGEGQTLAFFSGFDAALGTLADRLSSGYWDSDPATRTLAQQAFADGEALRSSLFSLMLAPATSAAVLPTAGSLAGAAIGNRITALQSQFSDVLEIGGFTGLPALPSEPLTAEGWEALLTHSAGLAGSLSAPPYTALGDVELGAAYLLIDRRPTEPWGSVFRLAVNTTVRLGTSQLANPARFFEIGTGHRQPDVEIMATADLARARGALRLAGWYNYQLPGRQVSRIGPLTQPLRSAAHTAALRQDPGNVAGVSVLPAYRLTPAFAILGGIEWWRRGEDSYEYDSARGQQPIEGAELSDLARDTGGSALSVRAGLTWSPAGDGRAPLDASVTWERVISASGGLVPQREVVRGMLRVYGRLW